METPLKFLLALALLFQVAAAQPFVIDDRAIKASFEKQIGAVADEASGPTADELAKAVKDCPRTTPAPPKVETGPDDPTRSVFLIGSVYKCDKCDKWHLGGAATAWAVSADGLMATNHHVIAKTKGAAMGISDREGKTWPITEIVASDPASDIALFRVKGSGFQPLPMGKPAAIGDEVRVISHPNGRYYIQTFGEVSRYHTRRDRQRKTIWMSITADFAKGSSGGPVLNERGEVIGMVKSTNSIYYNSPNGKPEGPLQMVIKNCVPVAAIREMFATEAD